MRPALYLYYHQNKKEERNLSKELKIRERDTQRQMDKNKIRQAKYNKKYKQLGENGKKPEYLEWENFRKIKYEEEMKALIKITCKIMREDKYWLKQKSFCDEGKDNFRCYIENY